MLLLTDFSDAPRFHCTRPISRRPAITAAGTRAGVRRRTKQVMQAQAPVAAVQATQLAIKHATSGQPGPVVILFSHNSLAGDVSPDFNPRLFFQQDGISRSTPPPADAKSRSTAAAERKIAASGNDR